MASHALFGRARALVELEATLARALAGEGSFFLLSGEAGIGKTRLAEELARIAQDHGAAVFWGRGQEGEAAADGPWVQVLRACVQADVGAAFMGEERGRDLASLLAGEHAGSAIVALVQRLAREKPLVLIFDDLDASDLASLNLLHVVVRSLRDQRVLVLGTCREPQARGGPRTSARLVELAREGTVRTLGLVDRREAAPPPTTPSHVAERALVRVGTMVQQYRIARLLGIGGMAAVYAATHRDGHSVAIKFMLERFRDDPKVLHFFRREAAVANRVGHPGAIPILAHDVDEQGCAFLIMPLLEGETLRARWERAHKSLPPSEVAVLMADVLDVLASAHAKGIVHRDVKPENLFLTTDGRTCVLDFGIARALDADGSATVTGSMIGTPAFMPPEQALGDRDGIGPHSDCWAAGATIFTLLSGEFVHRADSAQAQLAAAATRHARSLRQVMPDAPVSIVRFVDKALAFDPRDRWPSAREMREGLLTAFEEALGRPFVALATRARAALIEELAQESESTIVREVVRPAVGGSASGAAQMSAGLTEGEQRLICVIFAAAVAPGERESEHGHGDDGRLQVREVGGRFGASVEWLEDGGMLAVMRGEVETSQMTLPPTYRGAPAQNAVDQVVLAARCALELHAEMPGAVLAICTGRAELRDAASVGAIVTRARGMVRQASPGAIVVDGIAARLLELRFEIAEGRLLRPRATPARTLLGRPSPFVGRDRELGNLHAILDGCLEDRRPCAALLTGPAGFGKSRLVHEFLVGVRARHPDIAVWSACADPVTGGAPLWLLTQALRDAAQIHDREPRASAMARLEACVIQRVPEARVGDVRGLFSELIGGEGEGGPAPTGTVTPIDPALRAERVRRGFLALIASECAKRPVVIVLDDLQWADGASLRFVDLALGQMTEAPLLVIGVARPEIRDTFPWLWGNRRLEELRLPSMRRRAAIELARHVLGAAVSDTTIEHVVARADGNSFYLEELLRTVAEGRGDALPETVLAMAIARLDVLEPAARQRLRAGSVFGETFTAGDVDALLDSSMTGEQTVDSLARLVDQEVLVRQQRGASEPAHYRFRHGYLRDAAYSMLTEADRVLGHRVAAEWLERGGRTEPAIIAEHFECGMDGRAAAHYLAAARRAMYRSDPEGAIRLATRGLRGPGAVRETVIELRRVQAEAHALRGELGAVAELADMLMATTEPGSKAWWGALAPPHQGSLWRGPPARGRRSLRRLRESLAAFGKFPTYVHTVATLLPLIYSAGAHEFAEPLYRDFIDDATRVAEHDPLACGLLRRAESIRALMHGDDPWEAIRLSRAAIAPLEQAGDNQRALYVRGEIAVYLGDIADFDAHDTENRRLVELTVHMGLGPTIALGFWAYNLAELGRSAAAHDLVDLALARAVESRFVAGEGTVRAARATLLLQEGRFEEAEREARRAVRLAVTMPRFAAIGFTALVRARLALGQIASALRASRAAMALVTPPRSIGPTEVGVRLARADALHAAGDIAGARSAIATARARVLARAARCSDVAARRRYLEAVPAVALTLARASLWLDSESSVPSTKRSG